MDAALPRDVDICIVGGGPAGITLARELAVGPARLAIIESGGGTSLRVAGTTRQVID